MEMVSEDKTQQSMKMDSPKLGVFTYTEKDRFSAPSGLLGFTDEKNFILHKSKNIDPFIWLQSENNTSLSFLILDPKLCRPDFSLEMKRSQLLDLNFDDGDQNAIYVLASVPEDFKQTTLNFKGPLVMNLSKRLIQQVIVEQEELKVPLFAQSK